MMVLTIGPDTVRLAEEVMERMEIRNKTQKDAFYLNLIELNLETSEDELRQKFGRIKIVRKNGNVIVRMEERQELKAVNE